MSKLHEALSKLCEAEKTISVEVEGKDFQIVAAYPYPPHGNTGISTPCFIHTWTFLREDRHPNGWRQRFYTINLQLLAGRSGSDTAFWGQVCAAFDEEGMDTLDRYLMLADLQLFTNLRGKSADQPALYTWNDIGYIGLEYELDLVVTEITTVGIGI